MCLAQAALDITYSRPKGITFPHSLWHFIVYVSWASMCQTEHTIFPAFVSTSSNLSALFSWVWSERWYCTVLTVDAWSGATEKKIKFQPGDRAEKNLLQFSKKNLTFYLWKAVTFALVRCKGKPPTSREPYMINNHWMRWCLRPSSAYGHGNTYVTEKGVCLFIRQRIRTERSGLNDEE